MVAVPTLLMIADHRTLDADLRTAKRRLVATQTCARASAPFRDANGCARPASRCVHSLDARDLLRAGKG